IHAIKRSSVDEQIILFICTDVGRRTDEDRFQDEASEFRGRCYFVETASFLDHLPSVLVFWGLQTVTLGEANLTESCPLRGAEALRPGHDFIVSVDSPHKQ